VANADPARIIVPTIRPNPSVGQKPRPPRDTSEPPGLNPPPPLDIDRLRETARQIKIAKGLSIQDLVMASGLSRTAVLDMLNGRGRISRGRIDSWWALAWALGIPFGELMGSLD